MRAIRRRTERHGDARMPRVGTRVRLTMAVVLLAAVPAAAADVPSSAPRDFALSADGDLYLGNATRVVTRTPAAEPDAAPTDVPAPIAANGSLLLDERTLVGDAIARRDAKLRLLAEVAGDLVVTDGKVQLAGQAHVRGAVLADAGVVAGISSRVDGDLAAARGSVRIVRLARVRGNVFARREFRGDRDVVVGAPGTTVETPGAVLLRDRGEYFASILYEGTLTFVGTGEPTLRASVTQVSPGTLAAPAMPAWRLERLTLADADPGSQDVTVTKQSGDVTLVPGRYGRVVLGQESVVHLAPGAYDLDELQAQSDVRVVVEVADPTARVELRVRGDVRAGRRFAMDLGLRSDAERQARASRIRTVVGGTFRGDQDVVWAGEILAGKSIVLGKRTILIGGAWSRGDLDVGRDSRVIWVPAAVAAEYRPEGPGT